MGHLYPENLIRVLKELAAQSPQSRVTLRAFVDEAMRRKVGVDAAEGSYQEPRMYEGAAGDVFACLAEQGSAIACPATLAQRVAFRLWQDGTLAELAAWEDDSDLHPLYLRLYEVPFAISPDTSLIQHIEL